MGYTQEKGKNVIWTTTSFVSDKYPFQDEGENYTFFYTNLKDKTPFTSCLAALPESEKIKLVSEHLELKEDSIVLRSKKSHWNKINKSKSNK